MKRILVVLLVAGMLFGTFSSFADVIIEPENAFYRTHRNECEHAQYRVYVAETESAVYAAPYGMQVKTNEAGAYYGVQWIYRHEDGSVWGFNELWNGWVDLGGLKLRYDGISFSSEHAAEIVPNTEDRPFSSFFDGETAAVYLYPTGPFLHTTGGFNEDWSRPVCFYTDPDGRMWGFVGYQYGHIDAWVCLDDPFSETNGAAEAPLIDSGFSPAQGSGYTLSAIFWVIGTVVLVAATAGVLLLVILRKKKRKA